MDLMVFVSEQWLLVSLLGILVAALILVERKRGGETLSFHELTRQVNAGDAVVIDLRDSAEFKAGHIVDAINLPFAKLSDRAGELQKYQNKTIILVDKMGQHASAAAKTLKEKGFQVARMQGGMVEWRGQNLPVVKS